MDSNQPIDAPLVGDIESCLTMMTAGMSDWQKPDASWTDAISTKVATNVERMGSKLGSNAVPMDYQGALGRLKKMFRR